MYNLNECFYCLPVELIGDTVPYVSACRWKVKYEFYSSRKDKTQPLKDYKD